MAKDKSSKSELNLPKKKKKLSSNESQVPTEEIMETKVKKKRKNVEAEEAPVQIPSATKTTDNKKQKKDKKRIKKQATEQTQQTELTESSSCTEGTQELEGVKDQEEELSPEERRVLERKMKKILKKEEKKRVKAEGLTLQNAEAAGPSAPQQALDYLTCWAENRPAWKFQKTRQTWLLQHMFNSEKIPEENFFVLLQYLEGLRGTARDTSVQKALSLVEESGQAPDDTVVQQRARRAREVVQLFS
ncbi:protein cholesin [Odontesthes bonariensis]|uniref:protein cholesin n=1 Tax=Odontesthes bonariensis TaxID=219752 RepID=UPI003F58E2B0